MRSPPLSIGDYFIALWVLVSLPGIPWSFLAMSKRLLFSLFWGPSIRVTRIFKSVLQTYCWGQLITITLPKDSYSSQLSLNRFHCFKAGQALDFNHCASVSPWHIALPPHSYCLSVEVHSRSEKRSVTSRNAGGGESRGKGNPPKRCQHMFGNETQAEL